MFTRSMLSFSVLTVALTACSAKVSTPDIAAPAPKAFNDSVKGPSLDGEWKSECTADMFGRANSYVIIDMTIAGKNVSRRESTYTDSQCLQPGPEQTEKGIFRYASQKTANTYAVEYQFNVNGGAYIATENVKLDGGILYISDLLSNIDPIVPLKPVTAPTTTP